MSPILNNMWCIRVRPNGKTIKGNFALRLQLCGFPKYIDNFPVTWTVTCNGIDVKKARYTTAFSLKHSCWGWANDQLSFKKFKECKQFEIAIDIQIDNEENVRALAEWDQFMEKQRGNSSRRSSSGRRSSSRPNRVVNELDDEKQNESNAVNQVPNAVPKPPRRPPPNPLSRKESQKNIV